MQDGIMISRGGATLPPKPADGGKYGTANSGSPTNRGLHHNAGTLHVSPFFPPPLLPMRLGAPSQLAGCLHRMARFRQLFPAAHACDNRAAARQKEPRSQALNESARVDTLCRAGSHALCPRSYFARCRYGVLAGVSA
ncbi:hypothetical protein MRX96_049464 [Rhipicephalus microplus]